MPEKPTPDTSPSMAVPLDAAAVQALRASMEALRAEVAALKRLRAFAPAGTPIVGRLLSLKDVAWYLHVSERTVRTLIAEGRLIPIRIGGQQRFTMEGVEAFVRACPGGNVRRRRKAQPKRTAR